eukprot:gnl/MRDRNA2_/MRDRNA2_115839_c0_seq1.p1 gnl/MRDRNA2_/MRDRNA2_115839_c0~~gnl/MRDRNA2_/MRDRNA2_115839_c0_seq1.p1  ORF type:complete len:327 (+),score=36.58 gnl/MRDRNA2_/MRDRNA2_115839_c0_seq1:83-1063(+)
MLKSLPWLDIDEKALVQLRFVPLLEWLVLSCVNSEFQQWFERADVWHAACCLSACRKIDQHNANDIAWLSSVALCSIVSKMLRVALRCPQRPQNFSLSSPTLSFPSISAVHLVQHEGLWLLEHNAHSDFAREQSLLGAKLWDACTLFCTHLQHGREKWAEGLGALVPGCCIAEVGAGLGLLGMVASMLCAPSRTVITDGDDVCVSLVTANIHINALPNVQAAKLCFGKPCRPLQSAFDVVVASDVAYSLDLVTSVWKSVAMLLRPGQGTFIVAHMDRTPSATARLISRAASFHFKMTHQHDLYSLVGLPKHTRSTPALLLVFERNS